MGVIIKNGIMYSGGKGGDNSIELTKAEYDALSEEQKNNGTTYYVIDEESGNLNVDSELSLESENPVQNKVITGKINEMKNPEVEGSLANKVSQLSNPNLLINPDFKINQRGKSEYTEMGYSVDRWWHESYMDKCPSQLIISGSYVRIKQLSVQDGYNWNTLKQILDPSYVSSLIGKTLTFTAKHRGVGMTQLFVAKQNETVIKNTVFNNSSDWVVDSITFTVPDDATTLSVRIYSDVTGGCGHTDIEWAKLELGSIATPFVPPNHDVELYKCLGARGSYSNPNLLINPDFKINQRGGKISLAGTQLYLDMNCTRLAPVSQSVAAMKCVLVSSGNYMLEDMSVYGKAYVKASDVVDGYSGGAYTVDRWHLTKNINYNDSVVKVKSNGISLAGHSWFWQGIEMPNLFGKTCTLTIRTSVGDAIFTDKMPSVNGTIGSVVKNIGNKLNVFLECNANLPRVVINSLMTDEVIIYDVKLELGSVATPFVPPDPASELLKCQRYFWKPSNESDSSVENGLTNSLVLRAESDNNISLSGCITFPCDMRIKPTIGFVQLRRCVGNIYYSNITSFLTVNTRYALSMIFNIQSTSFSSLPTGYYYEICGFYADAEIY